MIDIDGMICRLMQLMQDTHTTAAYGSSSEDSKPELLLIHCLRAAEGEQNTARRHFLKCTCVQLCIAAQCILQRVLMFGKGRWIQDDEVILRFHLVQEAEGIFGKSLMTQIVWEIQADIVIYQLDSLSTAVNAVYQPGTPTHGIDTETTGVAEHIQYGTTLRVMLQQTAIITLIYKEARLLPLKPVNMNDALKGRVVSLL